jgi:hypothetical protein
MSITLCLFAVTPLGGILFSVRNILRMEFYIDVSFVMRMSKANTVRQLIALVEDALSKLWGGGKKALGNLSIQTRVSTAGSMKKKKKSLDLNLAYLD